jgi:triphosphoribosyl-dephospho-CoA synthetase
MRWDVVAQHLDEDNLSPGTVIDLVADTYGDDTVEQLAALLREPGAFCLSAAEAVAAGRIKSSRTARAWATAACSRRRRAP